MDVFDVCAVLLCSCNYGYVDVVRLQVRVEDVFHDRNEEQHFTLWIHVPPKKILYPANCTLSAFLAATWIHWVMSRLIHFGGDMKVVSLSFEDVSLISI